MHLIYIILIGLVWLTLLIVYNSKYALPFLFLVNIINYKTIFSSGNFELLFKIMFLITFLLLVIRRGFSKKNALIVIFLGLFFIANAFLADYDDLYKTIDWLTATVSLFSGLLCFLIVFNERDKILNLKVLTILPLFSVIIGLVLWPLGLTTPFHRGDYIGLSGASTSTNLAFYCVIAMGASIVLFRLNTCFKYRVLFYVNYAFLVMTLTRGGILSGTILLFIDLFPMIRFILKKRERVIVVTILFILAIIPLSFTLEQLIERTFTENGINTSGRVDAWKYIISLSNSTFFGNGYGFLKTRNDYQLLFFTAAHNEYVHLYVEIGIIGLIVFVTAYAKLIVSNIKTNKKELFLIMMAFCIYSIFDNTLTNYNFWLPFSILIASLFSYRRITNEDFKENY